MKEILARPVTKTGKRPRGLDPWADLEADAFTLGVTPEHLKRTLNGSKKTELYVRYKALRRRKTIDFVKGKIP